MSLGKINSGVDGVAGNILTATSGDFNDGVGFTGMEGTTVRMANGLRRIISAVASSAVCTLDGAPVICEPNQPFYLLGENDNRVTPAAATLFPGSPALVETLSALAGPYVDDGSGNGRWEDGPFIEVTAQSNRVCRFTLGNATDLIYTKADGSEGTLTASGDFFPASSLVQVYGPFLETWTGKIELVTQACVGMNLFWASGEVAKVLRMMDGYFIINADRAIDSGPVSIENPLAYARYTGVVERHHSRKLWSMPNLPRRFAAILDGTVDPTSNVVQLDYPVKSLSSGMELLITGAGTGGGNLTARVLLVYPNAVVLADAAITNAATLIQTAINEAVAAEATALAVKVATAATLSAANAALEAAKVANANPNDGATDEEVAALATAEAAASSAVDTAKTNNVAANTAYDTAVEATATAREAAQPVAVTIVAADAEASIAGLFEDLEGDGSGIVKALKLGGYLAIYKTSGSMFIARYTGNVEAPFVYDEIKVPAGACLPEKHRHTLIALDDNVHVWAGENEFYSFDTTSRVPKIFDPFRLCKSLFFNATGDKFAANNAITKELMFWSPATAGEDKALCYDYLFGTARTTSVAWTVAANVLRPRRDGEAADQEYWFAGGTSDGGIMRYGRVENAEVISGTILASKSATQPSIRTNADIFTANHVGRTILTASGKLFAIIAFAGGTAVEVIGSGSFTAETFTILPAVWHRDGAEYDSILESGLDDFGAAHYEKLINSYVLIPGSDSPNTSIAVMFHGGRNPATSADLQGATLSSPNTKNLLKPTVMQYYLGDRLTVSGKNNPFELQERVLTVVPRQSSSFGRRGNGT